MLPCFHERKKWILQTSRQAGFYLAVTKNIHINYKPVGKLAVTLLSRKKWLNKLSEGMFTVKKETNEYYKPVGRLADILLSQKK